MRSSDQRTRGLPSSAKVGVPSHDPGVDGAGGARSRSLVGGEWACICGAFCDSGVRILPFGESSIPAPHPPPNIQFRTLSPSIRGASPSTTSRHASPPVPKGISGSRPSQNRPPKKDPPDRRHPHSGPNPADSLSVSLLKRTRSFFGARKPPTSSLYFRAVPWRLTSAEKHGVRLSLPVGEVVSNSGRTHQASGRSSYRCF